MDASNNISTKGQLGPLLARLRRQRGLSQQALGDKIGLSQERISRIERHPERMSVDQLLTILMALEAALSVVSRYVETGKGGVKLAGEARVKTTSASKPVFAAGASKRRREIW